MAARVGDDLEALAPHPHAQRAHELVVTAIESLGHAQHGRQPAHDAAFGATTIRVRRVALLPWPRSAMVLRDQRDQRDLVGGQPAQAALANEIGRVPRVAVVGDGGSDVVQQCRELQPLAFAHAELVPRPQRIEQLHRQRGDMLRVAVVA